MEDLFWTEFLEERFWHRCNSNGFAHCVENFNRIAYLSPICWMDIYDRG